MELSRKQSVVEFYETRYRNSAVYANFRALPCVADGLKLSHRKIIHNSFKDAKEFKKVDALANSTASATEYAHGSSNLEGVIVTMTRSYTGSNNFPLLKSRGNFGTRLLNENSSTRYIYAKLDGRSKKMFIPDDNIVLIAQNFEGTNIEPQFFTPTVPVWAVNGSYGIGFGYSVNILPRKLTDVITYLEAIIDGKKPKKLLPSFNGFDGTVETAEKRTLFNGKFTRKNKTTILVTELPVGIQLKQYEKILGKLEDAKKIRDFTDLCDAKKDTFLFEIKVASEVTAMPDEDIVKLLKLSGSSTENINMIDEFNAVRCYENVEEAIDHFVEIKLDYLAKRKAHIVNELKYKLQINLSKYMFVNGYVKGDFEIKGKPKKEIVEIISGIDKVIKDRNNNYDYLLSMPIYSLEKTKLDSLKKEVIALKAELKGLMSKDIKDIWKEELSELKKEA